MFSIRKNVFETNSSTSHSLCICTEEEYEKFKRGELFFHYGKLVSKQDLPKEYVELLEKLDRLDRFSEDYWDKAEEIEDEISDYRHKYKTYDSIGEYLEYYDEHFTTPSGDKMVAFGEYGNEY